MILFDVNNKKLQVKADATATTTESPFFSAQVDTTIATGVVNGEKAKDGVTVGTTFQDVTTVPASGDTSKLAFFALNNADTVSHTYTIRYLNNATSRDFPVTLAVGDWLIYENGKGFYCTDKNGKQYFNPVATAASQSWAFTGTLSPSSLSTSQNDYNPTGLSTATIIRQNLSADINITGLAGGSDGRIIILENISASNVLTLKANSGSSSAANQFDFANDIVLSFNEAAILVYDGTTTKWRLIHQPLNALGQVEIWVDTPNGHGSTGTATRTFSHIQVNKGGASLTYNSDATNGDNITVNIAGLYSMDYFDLCNTAGEPMGITVNGVTSTSIHLQTSSGHVLNINLIDLAGGQSSVGCVHYCAAGDVLRAQDNKRCSGTDAFYGFRVCRIL